MRKRGLADWSLTAIPEKVFWPTAQYVAPRLLSLFGITGNKAVLIRGDGEEAMRVLQDFASPPDNLTTTRATYY